VHYVINLVNLQCDHYELTDVRGGETFRRIPIHPGDLMMGDRAYGTPPSVAHVVKEGGAVLSRIALHNMPLYTESGKKMPVLSRLRTVHVGQVREWSAWVRTGGESFPGRLVAVKRGRQATKAAEARVLRRATRKQQSVSADTLAAAAYVFVWTNVPVTVMDANDIMELYRLRWQIELAFKRMKSIMALGHLPKWSDASARAWIHGKLFVALLIERLLDAAETVSPWGYRLDASPEPMA
jgi:IS4 transposase